MGIASNFFKILFLYSEDYPAILSKFHRVKYYLQKLVTIFDKNINQDL